MMQPNPQPALIFVSHSHEDNEFSHQLVDDLRDALGGQTEVWHDVSGGLHGGDTWWNVIVKTLNRCDIFLLVMSPAAMRSNAVGAELDMAWVRKLAGKTRIIPIFYQQCEMTLDLTTLQYISFLPPKSYDRAVVELVAALYEPSRQDRYTPPPTELLPATHAYVPERALPPTLAFPPLSTSEPFPDETAATLLATAQALPHVVPTLMVMSIADTSPPRIVNMPGATVTIGREASNDLVIRDPTISRHHLRLERHGTIWHVHCLPDTADFYLNGEPRDGAELRSGDQVVIGGTVLRFELPDPLAGSGSWLSAPTTLHTSMTPSQLIVDCLECHFVAPLRQSVTTLGRAPECGLVIPAPVVSGHHAVLRYTDDGGYTITDGGGRNGLALGGHRIQTHALRSGDRLTIGADLPGHTVTLTYAALR